jgi:hypothetical protein
MIRWLIEPLSWPEALATGVLIAVVLFAIGELVERRRR